MTSLSPSSSYGNLVPIHDEIEITHAASDGEEDHIIPDFRCEEESDLEEENEECNEETEDEDDADALVRRNRRRR